MLDRSRMRLAIGAVTCTSIVLLSALLASAARGAPTDLGKHIAEQGSADGAPPCVSCHGAHLEGNSAVGAPSLAGRQKEFILARLAHYAGPDGHNPLMKPIALSLKPQERAAVAGYIAGLRPHPGQ